VDPAGYAQAPGAFRNRWSLRHFRFRWSSWIAVALLVAPVVWLGFGFADAHLALKGVIAVMALIAVTPLLRDFRRSQCRRCGQDAERMSIRDEIVTVCHRCRIVERSPADSSPLPL